MNRKSARNRHREQPLPPMPQLKRHVVDERDFYELVGIGQRIIPRFHAEAIWNSAQLTKAGVPAGIVGILASAGAVSRAVAQAIAKHVPEPKPDDDLRQVFPAWAVDILIALGMIPREEPVTEEMVVDEAADLPKSVEDETELAQRAAAAGLVIAT